MINYNFDIDKFIERYIPYVLRNSTMLAWLKSLLSPLKSTLNTFLSYVNISRRELQQNGQVIRLENLLNDLYDSVLRRIKITDSSQSALNLSNATPLNLSNNTPLNLRGLSDFNFGVNFVVKVYGEPTRALNLSNTTALNLPNTTPLNLQNESDSTLVSQITATVKKYKIAGVTFDVELVT